MELVNRDGGWIIYQNQAEDPSIFEAFEVVDQACDFLVDIIGIEDEEVDLALINMSITGHNTARFNATKFEATEYT